MSREASTYAINQANILTRTTLDGGADAVALVTALTADDTAKQAQRIKESLLVFSKNYANDLATTTIINTAIASL